MARVINKLGRGYFEGEEALAAAGNSKGEHMSKTWEHYHDAARHHEQAAYHYKEAAKYD